MPAHPFPPLQTAASGLCLAVCLLFPSLSAAAAQQASAKKEPTPVSKDATLDDLLLRMGKNQAEFTSSIPSFFCSEHAVSESLINTPFSHTEHNHTITDSIFRLQRRSDPSHWQLFDETRLIQQVDGKPARSATQSLTGPALLFGVFAYGLRLISVQESACLRYRLRSRKHDADQIVIEFKDRPDRERAPSCGVSSHSQGAAYIDPGTLRIVRLSQKTPNYEILPNVFSEWRWTVDYAPVRLGNDAGDAPYWLPKTIHSIANKDREFTWWSFDATYQGCHKVQSGSRIVTDSLKTVPEP